MEATIERNKDYVSVIVNGEIIQKFWYLSDDYAETNAKKLMNNINLKSK